MTLLALIIWMNVTTVFALNPADAWPMWERVMKILIMVFAAGCILHSKRHVQSLIWVLALSVGFYSVKGGLFTLSSGGQFRVWGPPGSFIEENNALALATVMTIPLLRYLHLQAKSHWLRWSLLAAMLLSGFSAFGSHSRGALLAVFAMLAFLWLKGDRKLMTGALLAVFVPFAIGFMPAAWEDRMRTIENYSEDASARGRINSWLTAINVVKNRPGLGGGFEFYSPDTFARYAPDPTRVRSAHSIYFQVLGEHAYVGLLLFLLLWFFVWRDASWIIRSVERRPNLRWASNLANMVQVSLVGYFVGGAFLNLAYYDVPYYLLVAVIVTRLIVAKEINEPTPQAGPSETAPQALASS
jgi:probable O-glycosylation ligase (exosortase A-associated)